MQLIFNFLVSFLLCLFGSFFEGNCVVASRGGDGGDGESGGVGFQVQIYLLSRVTPLDTMMPTSAVTGPEFRERERERDGPDHRPAVSTVGTHQREHCQQTSA